MIRTSAYLIRSQGEAVGVAYGMRNLGRAADFLRTPTGLPSWITESAWDSLVAARRALDVEPPLSNLARGTTRPDDAGGED